MTQEVRSGRATALTSAANDTKWEELRVAMHAMAHSPSFRCMNLSGYYSEPDDEWLYHFRDGGYDDLEFVDLLPSRNGDRAAILAQLKAIGLAGHTTDQGFRVYGYVRPGDAVDYF